MSTKNLNKPPPKVIKFQRPDPKKMTREERIAFEAVDYIKRQRKYYNKRK